MRPLPCAYSKATTHFLFLLLLFCFILPITNAARILVYCPSISKSHVLLCGKYADLLHNAQHDTVLFIPSYSNALDAFDGAKSAKVWRLRNISDAYDKSFGLFDDVLENSHIGFIDKIKFDYDSWIPHCRDLASQMDRMQHLIDYNFDLAIIGDVDYCNHAIVRSLGIKNTVLLSTEPIMDKIALDLGIPSPSSYVPAVEENPNHDIMSFYDRMINMYKFVQSTVAHYIMDENLKNVFKEIVDPNFPSIREIVKNVSIVFVNSNEMLDIPRPISPKVIYIGMIEGDEQKASLPKKLDNIFNKGNKGSIYVSFGTVAPFNQLPIKIKNSILEAIKTLTDYHFVLKIVADDTNTSKMFVNISNVDLVDWVPQNAVLRHQNLKLFVSHGGMNSVLEAMTYGVPMLVMPVFTDQFRNAKNVERRGAGEMINRKEIEEDTFTRKISELLTDEKYERNAKRMSKLMRNRPFSPEQRVLKWIDFVLKNYPFTNFELESNNLGILQLYHLDLIIYSIIISVGVVFLSKRLILRKIVK